MSVCAFVVLFVVLPALAGGRASIGGAEFARQQSAVLARVGDTAVLRCRVLRLGDRAVSWVRSSDLQILTHAGAVFTADSRVSCGEEEWEEDEEEPEEVGGVGGVHTLRIEKLRLSDAGRYECQVNTEPKLSSFFNLTVIEDVMPSVSIRALGARSAVLPGGSARLACEARYEPATLGDALAALPPLRIRWEHNGEILDPQSSRGGISLDTERWAGRAVSRLTLARLSGADGGRYSCVSGDARAFHDVRIEGEEPPDYEVVDGELESMQRDQAAARTGAAPRWAPHALLVIPWLLLLVLS